jgi:ABC-type branched-subunit amino acid transport system ATPase component
MPDALRLEGITVRYGGVTALDGVSLAVTPGTTLGLIGPNGAGKTTLINATTGIAPLASGSISLGDRRLDGQPPYRIARAGIARTYQNIRLFGALDVRTNLAAGAYAQPGRLSDDAARALLERAGVAHLALDTLASALPYGDQRRLEIARGLASRPAILMLDEPAAGMNPTETARLVTTIRSLAAEGIGILLIEHDMTLVRAASDHVVVLNFGEVLARGTPAEIARNPAVVEAYLGTTEHIAPRRSLSRAESRGSGQAP